MDGHDFPVPFQNMRVDVPILSVRKYVKAGFSFHFSEEGGFMQSNINGKRFDFIESDGAFWIKMKVSKPGVAPQSESNVTRPSKKQLFARPGRP